ncbi:MAG: DUF4349 domain-containing protein, partial [Actinobacteria bacterium]|nr:DUF4349 domain-containing protein [Actinomycetota bacterium]
MRRLHWTKGRAALAGVIALLAAGSVVAATGQHKTKALSGVRTMSSAGVAQSKEVAGTSTMAAAGDATGAAAGSVASPSPSPSPSPGPQATPNMAVAGGAKVIKTATMRVKVGRGRFDDAFAQATSIAGRYQGYVSDSSSQTHDKQAAEGSLTIRVPAEHFDDARADLGRLGSIDHVDINGQDVSAQLVDYAARVRSLQSQEEALQTLLSKAHSVGEVLEVQGQLFNVRQQIEQLQAQQANLDAQATFATITVTLFEPGAAVTPPKPVPATGLARSWHLAVHGS